MEDRVMKDMNKLEIVYVAVEKIKPYANNPRINKKAVEKVMKSIQAYGFKVPCVLDKNYLLITGHTRWEAAKRLKMKRIPCIIASDLNKAKADAFRIADNKVAEYSTWDMTKLKEELSKIQLEDIEFDDMGFDNDFSIEKLGLVDMPEGSDGDEGEIETEKYSTKTNIPQYEIQGLNIKLSDCIDKQKYVELLKEIENSTVSDAQKKFLKLAATRHIRFIYKNIAEYYASTNSEMQRLMEHSALVIIDIDDAIRNGYARLTKEVMAARKRDSKKNEEQYICCFYFITWQS